MEIANLYGIIFNNVCSTSLVIISEYPRRVGKLGRQMFLVTHVPKIIWVCLQGLQLLRGCISGSVRKHGRPICIIFGNVMSHSSICFPHIDITSHVTFEFSYNMVDKPQTSANFCFSSQHCSKIMYLRISWYLSRTMGLRKTFILKCRRTWWFMHQLISFIQGRSNAWIINVSLGIISLVVAMATLLLPETKDWLFPQCIEDVYTFTRGRSRARSHFVAPDDNSLKDNHA